jgi:glutathione synthase/RimK-type ligase-like ATP-grasp enzyme
MILVVTHSADIGADLVIRHLNAQGIRFVRVDTDLLGTPKKHFGFDGHGPLLKLNGTVLQSAQVSSVWARRFAAPKSLMNLESDYRSFASRELRDVMDAFLESVPGLTVNPFEADRKAGNRLRQSMIAKSVGLIVPESLVTQDSRQAQLFANARPCIAKAISYGSLTEQGEQIALTSQVTNAVKFEGMDCCPVLFQAEIRKMTEWRVTTGGQEVFAARTREGASVDRIDWRRSGNVSAIFETATLPDEVSIKILKMCRECGIYFGAHDLIQTPDGEFVFLETNPAGQWGWLELTLGMPIGAALASLLAAGKESAG